MITLPGLVDVHVHLRQPGAEHKEDWSTGTAAALAGGVTTVLAMPNTSPPVVDEKSFGDSQALAVAMARCDYGIYVGATAANSATAHALAPRAAGLKMYLDNTFGELRLDAISDWAEHLAAWPKERPAVAHAERRTAAAVILAATLAGRPIHICHVSSREEIELISRAKDSGVEVTCEVAPHHLFLTDQDEPAIGAGRSEVRPPLPTADDQAALWEHLDAIDCFATDHAPHLVEEKDGASPPPGFPGLETALPLLLTAVSEGRLELADVISRMHTNPMAIFGLTPDDSTYIEVDPDASQVISAASMFSKAAWTPFEGRTVRGRVERVVLRGAEVFAGGIVTAEPGTGRDVRTEDS